MSGDWRSEVLLGPALQAGDWWVAGVARWHLGAYISGRKLLAEGAKMPLALMLDGPGGRQALSIEGVVLTPEALEALLPEAWSLFDAAVQREKISASNG